MCDTTDRGSHHVRTLDKMVLFTLIRLAIKLASADKKQKQRRQTRAVQQVPRGKFGVL